MTETVRIKKKFNVTIPKKVRKKLKLSIGQFVYVSQEGNRIVLKPLPYDPSERLQELIGSLTSDEIKRQAEKIILKESKSGLSKRLRSE